MSLFEKINRDYKSAFTKKDEFSVGVLRLIKSAIQNEEIAKKKKDSGLSEEEVLRIFLSEAKKRRDSIEVFTKGGRIDLAAKEQRELDFITTYLPKQLSEEEVKKIVQEVVASLGEGIPNFGAVMGKVMARVKGQADGTVVSRLVKEQLTASQG